MKRWIIAAGFLFVVACERESLIAEPTPEDAGSPDVGPVMLCGGVECASGEVCVDGVCCRPHCEGKECGSDGCGGSCGTCSPSEVCADSVCCAPACAGKECGPDGCGGSCGTCEPPEFCAEESSVCTCEGELEWELPALCLAQGIECGPATVIDRCGVERTVDECGPCPGDGECNDHQQCAYCSPEGDIELCERLGKNCGAVQFEDNCGNMRSVASCGLCPEGKTCGPNNICRGERPNNDGCASPERLSFDSAGMAKTIGDTTHGDAADTGSCGGGTEDVVYVFEMETESAVEIVLTPGVEPTHRPVMYVRSECANAASQPPGACAFGERTSGATRLVVPRLESGTWYLWVAGVGPFELTLKRISFDSTPAHDLCEYPMEISLSNSEVITILDDTTWATDHSLGTCGQTNGPDLVYSITLDEPAAIIATVASSGFVPAVYLRKDCGGSQPEDELSCEIGRGTTLDVATVIAPWVPSGKSFLIVDGEHQSYGAFALEVRRHGPVDNDNCETARLLEFEETDTAAVALVEGDLAAAAHDGFGGCTWATKDVVFTFTTSEERKLEARIHPSGSMTPLLFLRSVCSDATSELKCVPANAAGELTELVVSRLSAGEYWLWVGAMGYEGEARYELTVQLSEPGAPDHDTCAAPRALEFDEGNSAIVHDDTNQGNPDYLDVGRCLTGGGGGVGSTQSDGPDLVYSFSLSTPSSVLASLKRDPEATTYFPSLYIRSSCESQYRFDEAACARAVPNEALLVAPSLPAGVYYLFVDGTKGSGGLFSLEV